MTGIFFCPRYCLLIEQAPMKPQQLRHSSLCSAVTLGCLKTCCTIYISTPEYQSVDEYSTALMERLQQSYQWVQKYASKKQQHQKAVYDLKCRGTSYRVNDLVFLHSPAVPRNKCKKFHRPWRGPFKVTKVVGPCVYRIVDCSNSRRKYVVHFNRLKPAPSKLVSERRQLPEPFEEDSRDNTAEHHAGDEEEDYTVDESTERGEIKE